MCFYFESTSHALGYDSFRPVATLLAQIAGKDEQDERKRDNRDIPSPLGDKSAVWTYFRSEDTICQQCRKEIKYVGNTTNVAAHLRKKQHRFFMLTLACQKTSRQAKQQVKQRSEQNSCLFFLISVHLE